MPKLCCIWRTQKVHENWLSQRYATSSRESNSGSRIVAKQHEHFILLICSTKQALQKHADSKKQTASVPIPQRGTGSLWKGISDAWVFSSCLHLQKWPNDWKQQIKGQNSQAETGEKATDYLKKSGVFQCTGLVKVNPFINEENLQENVCCQRFPFCALANRVL